jgi:hypothetical protein
MKKRISPYLSLSAFCAAGVFGAAVNSHAAMTSLIDFATLGTDVTPLITSAVTTAAGIGAMILAAKLCWGFFRRFTKG